MSNPNPGLLERIEPMIRLTERLTELIAAQASAFEAGRPHEAAANLEEITQMANIYRHESKRFRDSRDELAAAPAALRQRLRRATEAFDAVVARQERAVNAARTVTEGLVHAIATEVANQRSAGTGYGPTGVRSLGPPGVASAIALNQRA